MQPGQQEGAAMSDDTRSPPLNNVITINHMESGGGGGEVERRLAVRECAPDMGAPPDSGSMIAVSNVCRRSFGTFSRTSPALVCRPRS